MNTVIRNIILPAILIAFINACDRHDHHVAPASVNIEILKPQTGLAYGPGDSVKMHINITSPAPMHGYELHITRLSDNKEVYYKEKDLHEKDCNIREFWMYNENCNSEMELEIIAHIDHEGNTSSKKTKFYCH